MCLVVCVHVCVRGGICHLCPRQAPLAALLSAAAPGKSCQGMAVRLHGHQRARERPGMPAAALVKRQTFSGQTPDLLCPKYSPLARGAMGSDWQSNGRNRNQNTSTLQRPPVGLGSRCTPPSNCLLWDNLHVITCMLFVAAISSPTWLYQAIYLHSPVAALKQPCTATRAHVYAYAYIHMHTRMRAHKPIYPDKTV